MAAPKLQTAALAAFLVIAPAAAQQAERPQQFAEAAQAQPVQYVPAAMTGSPVTIRYGSGVSPSGIEAAERAIERHGCDATAVAEPRLTGNTILVRTAGRGARFTDAGAAAGWAIDFCR